MSANSVSRMNYFSGEALLTADFQTDQDYHKQMRERLSQGLLLPGILEGLEVDCVTPAHSVTVKPGTAIDVNGQLIVLLQDTPYTPTLGSEPNYFLTISFQQDQDDFVSNTYGQGYKRWKEAPALSCGPTYDPNGSAILLAVLAVSGGQIQSVSYKLGNYTRQHVGATLQSIEFVDGSDTPPLPAASVSMGGSTLTVAAPDIDLDGAVTANNVLLANGTFKGHFSGTFTGNGLGLTVPQSSNYWTKDPNGNLWFDTGKVTVGDSTASAAYLTVRQGVVPPKVATGLISLQPDGKTLLGFQTEFTTEFSPGDLIVYDSAPAQAVIIADIKGPSELIMAERFPIDIGPSLYQTQRKGHGPVAGAGTVAASGTAVTCSGTFPSDLQPGDTLILNASIENSPKSLRVISVINDNKLTVAAVTGDALTGGPKLSAYSGAPSMLLEVGGDSANAALPLALAVSQNAQGQDPANSVAINVPVSAANADYALQVGGPASLSGAVTIGGAVTVGGDFTVQNELKVDTAAHLVTVDHDLDVDGKLTVGGALDASNGAGKFKSLDVSGAVTIEGTLQVPDDKTTLKTLEVTGDAKIDGQLTVGSLKGFSVNYFGTRNITPYPLSPNGDSVTVVSGNAVTADGILVVTLGTLAMTCDAGFGGSLSVKVAGADGSFDSHVAVWSQGQVTNSRIPLTLQPQSISVPCRNKDTYTILFSTNGVQYSGVTVTVVWQPFGS